MENQIKIDYPQKVNLIIEFPLDIEYLDKQNMALDDFWDEVLENIKTPLLNNRIEILANSETHINADYTSISYHAILFVKPPFLDIENLIISLSKLNYPNHLCIKTKEKYIKNEYKILYKTT